MNARRHQGALALAALALGCATPQSAPYAPALVSVEVLSGFSREAATPGEQRAPYVVLLDATTSMLEPTRQRTPHHVAAQRAAARFASNVAALQPVWLFTMGSGDTTSCQPVFRGARARNAAARGPLLDEIRAQEPRGEASLAKALEGIHAELWRSDALLGSRVVVFSDLGSQCGGNVCAAAAKLIERGVRLDFVAIGDARAPACLREPAGLAESLPPASDAVRDVHFRLERTEPEPHVAGCSVVGGLPVAAPTGRGTVIVELDPPLRVDTHFASGRRHVLQVLDFPGLEPPRRHWRWRPVDGAAEDAAIEPPMPGEPGEGEAAP